MELQQAELVERLRERLVGEPSIREVPMFGGLSFMVFEKMVVSAQKDGALLVRVSPEQGVELAKKPEANVAEMGTGRTMGPSWISVTAQGVATDEGLSFWLDLALAHRAAS